MAAEDGADPPSDPLADTTASSFPQTNAVVQPAFNPIPYNFPTRFSIPSGDLYSSMLLSLWHKNGTTPNGKAVLTYLNDIDEMGKTMSLTEGEMVSMALYYADPDNRLLWKELINSSKGNNWTQFKKDVKWYYPDAYFDAKELSRTLYELGSAPRPLISAPSTSKPIFGFHNAVAIRSYVVGFLRITEDLSHIRHKVGNRVICQRFSKGLVDKELKKKVGQRLREKYPKYNDEFDCLPRIFFYYTFFVWRDELLKEERKWLTEHGF